MNRRTKRTKRSKRNKRSNMRGGSGSASAAPGKISMTVQNVGKELVSLQWWDNSKNAWSGEERILPPGAEDTQSTYVGTPWRVTEETTAPKGPETKELSWVLGNDGREQKIHVDFSPSFSSLTWAASPSRVESGATDAQADDGMTELQRRRFATERLREAKITQYHDEPTGTSVLLMDPNR